MEKLGLYIIIFFLVSCSKVSVDIYMNKDVQLIIKDSTFSIYSNPEINVFSYSEGNISIENDTVIFKSSNNKQEPFLFKTATDTSYSVDSVFIFSNSFNSLYILLNDYEKMQYESGIEYISVSKRDVNSLKIGNSVLCYESNSIKLHDANILMIDCNYACSTYDDKRLFSMDGIIAIKESDTIKINDSLCRNIKGLNEELIYFGNVKVPRKYSDFSNVEFRKYIFNETLIFRRENW